MGFACFGPFLILTGYKGYEWWVYSFSLNNITGNLILKWHFFYYFELHVRIDGSPA